MTPLRSFDLKLFLLAAFAVVVALVVVAQVVFAFQHPELTDTQRFLRFWEALGLKP